MLTFSSRALKYFEKQRDDKKKSVSLPGKWDKKDRKCIYEEGYVLKEQRF